MSERSKRRSASPSTNLHLPWDPVAAAREREWSRRKEVDTIASVAYVCELIDSLPRDEAELRRLPKHVAPFRLPGDD